MGEKKSESLKRLTGKGLYPPAYSWMLLLPLRNLYLSPGQLASRLSLSSHFQVLEMGCGPAYFSPTIASRIPRGTLHMTDVQPGMIERAKRRMEKRKIKNFDAKMGNGHKLEYPDSSMDVVFLVTVFGEMENTGEMVQEMFRVLKQGGLLSISEQGGDPDALPLEQLRALLEPEGFSLQKVFGKGRTFTANFRKGESAV